MFARLARAVSDHWFLTLCGWIFIPLGIHLMAPRWETLVEDGEAAYLPPRMSSVRGALLMKRAFPSVRSQSQAVVVVARPRERLSDADYGMADQIVEKLTPDDSRSSPVTAVWSYSQPIIGRELISSANRSGQATLILLNLRTDMAAVENMAFIGGLGERSIQ